ncbi:MAG: TonB-dependent receptor [Flavobacteriaceae bacterium]
MYPKLKPLFSLILFFSSTLLFAQEATITGVILDEMNLPIQDVTITYGTNGTKTSKDGDYSIQIPIEQDITLTFSHVSFKKIVQTFNLKQGQSYEFNPVLKSSEEQLGTIIITGNKRKRIEGITTISPKLLRKIPGGNAGVENILKTLAGVSGNNELSSQYNVRGGNFDENLVYVNEIEVYRPFLVRSGQQEGLSFVNSDLVQNVDFSAGGFQAKYGDKLSSVLDITYKNPKQFGASVDASLLGGSVSVEGTSKDNKLSGVLGVRYRDNSLFVKAKETETNYDPKFADVQTYLTYKLSNKLDVNFLGNLAINKYNYQPQTRQTNFGTLTDPIALVVHYEGQEKDQYNSYFGALKTNYKANDNLTLKFIGSAYHTVEEEYFDILANYALGEVNTNIGDEDYGEVEFTEGIGSQLHHARNDLDALILSFEHKGNYKKDRHKISWGAKYNYENIRDKIIEWEVIDSAGFSVRPIGGIGNSQPYTPYNAPLEPFQNIHATNDVTINRLSGFIQYNGKGNVGDHEIFYNAGVRAHNWTVSGDQINTNSQIVFSPRAQVSIKPEWKKDITLRLAAGLYHQPPFYRELRDANGTVNPKVKAQQSIHAIFGGDYNFKLWDRPFKLSSDIYYKSLSNVNPYTVDNVRIRYAADNSAKAYATGLDIRLNGEFVPGTESWFSFGYLKTEENINNRGYISRPTDQRLKFGALFQDYMPNLPNVKVYLNLVYNTGVPGGSPSYADQYQYQNRLRDYKRADAGFSYVIVDDSKKFEKGHLFHHLEELQIGFEIFNMFDVQNSITNTWVRDVYTKSQYAVPNYLTPRIFNLRLGMKF